MRAGPWSSPSPSVSGMAAPTGVGGVLLLLRVRVLAELVRATRRRWISCGLAPRLSICPSWLQPSAVKEPFLISASDGTLEVTSPVACHMPRGGLELMKDCRIEEVRRRDGDEVDAVAAALLAVCGRGDDEAAVCCWPVGTDAMGDNAGKGSTLDSVGLAMVAGAGGWPQVGWDVGGRASEC